jgi:hypothetical protein
LRIVADSADVFEDELDRATVPGATIERFLEVLLYGFRLRVVAGQEGRVGLSGEDKVAPDLLRGSWRSF